MGWYYRINSISSRGSHVLTSPRPYLSNDTKIAQIGPCVIDQRLHHYATPHIVHQNVTLGSPSFQHHFTLFYIRSSTIFRALSGRHICLLSFPRVYCRRQLFLPLPILGLILLIWQFLPHFYIFFFCWVLVLDLLLLVIISVIITYMLFCCCSRFLSSFSFLFHF